jgi:hypothetical protein
MRRELRSGDSELGALALILIKCAHVSVNRTSTFSIITSHNDSLLDGPGTDCYYNGGFWDVSHPMKTAPVAQWIEHAPSKRGAVGSSPTGRATAHNPLPSELPFPDYLQRLPSESLSSMKLHSCFKQNSEQLLLNSLRAYFSHALIRGAPDIFSHMMSGQNNFGILPQLSFLLVMSIQFR